MSKLFFTSDTHFNSERALKLSKRGFKTVDEMDKSMIKNWNSVVKSNDVVFHLGDFGDYSIANLLNGRIFLLLGNYEREEFKDLSRTSIRNKLEEFGINLFPWQKKDSPENKIKFPLSDFLANGYITDKELDDTLGLDKRFKNDLTNFLLSHEPIVNSEHITETGSCNLFGHIHGRQKVKRYGLDVGVDAHNYYPISLQDVLFYVNAIMYHYDKYVFY